MRDSWLDLVDRVLRPARPQLDRCLELREPYLEARRRFTDERSRAIASCEARIEAARAVVLAAKDGVVTSEMTDLEAEWRRLSRTDPDGGLMDLWARIAPSSWIDRKRWRDSHRSTQLDAAIALAADPAGVDAAERAVHALRAALGAWSVPIGARVRWRCFEHDFDATPELLEKPRRVALEALSMRDGQAMVLSCARGLERDVLEAAWVRFPERPDLGRALAEVAFLDVVSRAAPLAPGANPVSALVALWRAGYVLAAVDEHGVTVEIPAL
jgi:hypothetical protein